MAKDNYKDFYNKVGRINGWDFSNIKCTIKDANWNFFSEVKKLCKSEDILLDIGTGGGESLLDISSPALFLIVIDLSSSMIEKTRANLHKSDIANVRFLEMDAEKLKFPNGFFDVVSCRHSPFNAKEIARVEKQWNIYNPAD